MRTPVPQSHRRKGVLEHTPCLRVPPQLRPSSLLGRVLQVGIPRHPERLRDSGPDQPEDWLAVDRLVDWLTEKNHTGYQMVNSVQRLQGIKAFVRMSSGLDLNEYGWNGDGTNDGSRPPDCFPESRESSGVPAVRSSFRSGIAGPARTT